MRVFLLFVAYLAAALILAAAVYKPLFDSLALVGNVDPVRLLYRFAMLLALFGFWPFLRWLDLNRKEQLGLAGPGSTRRREVVTGFLCGVLILSLLIFTLLALEVRVVRPWTDELGMKIARTASIALFAGLLIAVIEEVFFRGAMFSAIRRTSNFWLAATLTSLLYAALHFVRPAPPVGEVDWTSGIVMLSGAFYRYSDFAAIADSFIALFIVGLFLAVVRERSGGIALCIGLHAGWVFVIKLSKDLTVYDGNASLAALVGSYDRITGFLAAAWLIVLGALYWHYRPHQP